MAAPKKYPDELRERAVRLYRQSDPKPTIRRLAEQLGVHHEAFRTWIRQADKLERQARDIQPDAAGCSVADRVDLAGENRRLRAENAEPQRVNEILRLASANFAQELGSTRRRS